MVVLGYRFQEAQKQKEERFQKALDSLYDDTIEFVKEKRKQLKKHVLRTTQELKDRHRVSTEKLAGHVDNIRSRKSSLQAFFREQETRLKV